MNAIINDLTFIFFSWLVFITIGYFSIPSIWRLSWVALNTFIFLLLASPFSCLWLSCSTFTTWIIIKFYNKQWLKFATIIAYGGMFIVSQYCWNMTIDYLPNSISLLGVAYYTCRQIHVLAESYKGNITFLSLSDYIHYQFFFPTVTLRQLCVNSFIG